MKTLLSALMLMFSVWAEQAWSIQSMSCNKVRIGVVDWTDLHVVNGIAKELLTELGYQVDLVAKEASPAVFEDINDDNIDVFMGYWTPTMTPIAEPWYNQKGISTLTANLDQARWTLAVPDYVYREGLQDFADIARFADKLEGRIYGLEKGSSGNEVILDMIATNAFGLKDFSLIETSERLMLAQVNGRVKRGEWIVFMGWQPHPMNQNFNLRYLSGGDDYFGPNYGHAVVNTSVRPELPDQCPNLARFFNNLTFVPEVEEAIMDQLSKFVPVDRAVRMWMHENPAQVSKWLEGVKAIDGRSVDAQKLAQNMEVVMGR